MTWGSAKRGSAWTSCPLCGPILPARPSPTPGRLEPEQRDTSIPLSSPAASQGLGLALTQDPALPAQPLLPALERLGGWEGAGEPSRFPAARPPGCGSGCDFAECAIKLNPCQGRMVWMWLWGTGGAVVGTGRGSGLPAAMLVGGDNRAGPVTAELWKQCAQDTGLGIFLGSQGEQEGGGVGEAAS